MDPESIASPTPALRLAAVARYARDLRRGGPALTWTLAVEALAIAGIVGLTFRLFERKKSFL